MKYRTGFKYVSHWTGNGIFRIGNAKPLNMNAGVEKKNDDIMACCCVCEMVERNRPAPSDVMRNNTAHPSNNRKLPRSGTWNTSSATPVINATSTSPTIANG